MLPLTAANAVAVLLFGALYAIPGARRLPPGVFLACLALMFGMVTALWVQAERQNRGFDPVRRLGRVALGLVSVVFGVPALLLMPLFWLESHLPPAAGLTPLLATAMTVVLIALVLTVLVNVVGGAVAAGRGLLARRRPPTTP
jgi:hypothetical protein